MIVVTIAPATAAIETKAAAFGLSTLDVFLVSVTTTRTYSRNLGQRSIMVRKGTFFEKGPQKLLYILIIRFGTPLHLTQTFWFIIKLSSATSISYKVKCRNRILESVY